MILNIKILFLIGQGYFQSITFIDLSNSRDREALSPVVELGTLRHRRGACEQRARDYAQAGTQPPRSSLA